MQGFTINIRLATLAVAAAAALAVTPAAALNIDSTQVVVPVVAHLPGHNGTQWRSDVWIQSPYSDTLNVTLSYYPEAGGTLTHNLHLGSYQGAYLHDIVLETFGLNNSKGMLIVSADHGVEARARVYNTGNACGEFGQAVPGLPLDRLGRQGLISGATTAGNTRLAIGIANPTDRTFTVNVYIADGANTGLVTKSIDLSPHQLVQLNRVASLWGLPARDIVMIDVESLDSANLIYAYASVVRNDTGDATFLFGTSPNTGPQ
jgi:hypothetical protein